ncbi:ubiquinone biosynthesis protein coq9 [Penicillium brasilianum]|uniref:Ubiquinone biosynthesis protein n=1 Tax=Penicillium brasilianum TaxID=104259 RepID=A0A1S9R9W7_PENBI|nr:ubiquinone biosynthesis protein coq9 [Penicillium brasilianum]
MASLPRLPAPRRALSTIQSIRPMRPFHTVHHRPSPSPSLTYQPFKTTPPPPTTPSIHIRAYHSPLHPRLPPHEYTNSQTAILTASLPHIPTHGFTTAALTRGAQDAGFLDVSVQLLPRGEFDLILFWLASRRGLLRGRVEDGSIFGAGEGLSVDEKVKLLVLERLRMNGEIREVWQDALAQMSLLGNIPLSVLELHALSNDILTLAGDAAVDATWYARRMALGAIYASAEVVMTRDPSPDLVETEAFVERRFADKEVLREKVEGVSSWVGFWGNTAVGVGRSWGLKI